MVSSEGEVHINTSSSCLIHSCKSRRFFATYCKSRRFFPLPTFSWEKVATFIDLKKSGLFEKVGDFYLKSRESIEKVAGRLKPARIRAIFHFFGVISKSLCEEKEGEGFVVFLNDFGGNLASITITIKDF
jgi:hypothetical protein